MQISLFIFDSYTINLCLGYQLCLIYLLIPLYPSIHLHRYPGIFLPDVWTLPSESCLPFCLEQMYSYLCGQGGDVTLVAAVGYLVHYGEAVYGSVCSAPAPHSKCLGQSIARFMRPFDSRPADPARHERYHHLVLQSGNSGVIPAMAAVTATPCLLDSAEGPSSAHRRGFMCRRRLEL